MAILNRQKKDRIVNFLVGMGISKNQSRRLMQNAMGINGDILGTIQAKIDGDQFLLIDRRDGMRIGLDLISGELI